jgi:hypothetical protein
VAAEAVGVAAGVVAEPPAGVADVGVEDPGVVPGAADTSSSDIWNVTGNGHPLPFGPEDELAAVPLLDVEARLTDPTPCTRRRATIVAATADCDAAHPLIETADVFVEGVDDVVPAAAAATAVESAEGDAALRLLSAALAGITPPIWLSRSDHGKRPETR